MNTGQQFKHYIWIVNTLRQHGRLTLGRLKELWVEQEVAEGNPLPRSSFNKYRGSILDEGDQTKQWMLSTIMTGFTLSDSSAIKDSILLENVPAGYGFLPVILQAIRQKRVIMMGYQKFGSEGYVKPVNPYAVRLFRQRWYMLADNGERMSVYSLDRMHSVALTDQRFVRPEDFSPEAYFSEYYGVMTDGTPLAHVQLRAYGKMANLLRTLPLHASQRELRSGEGYTDFALDIRPSIDFISELLSKIDGIEVLKPESLRAKIQAILEEALRRNSQKC